MASWVNLSSNHLWKNSNSIETIPEKWRNANSFYRASTVLTAKLDVLQKNYRPISLKDTDAKLLWNTARQINNILREVNMTSRGSLRSLRLGQHLGGGEISEIHPINGLKRKTTASSQKTQKGIWQSLPFIKESQHPQNGGTCLTLTTASNKHAALTSSSVGKG